MADVIEFPCPSLRPDALPEPGDVYRAYALPGDERYPMLTLVFPGGSMLSYRFSNIEQMDFSPAHEPDSLDVLNLHFAWPWASELATVRIEGRNLLDLAYRVGQEVTRWLRVLPAGRIVEDPSAPVITRIVLPPGKP